MGGAHLWRRNLVWCLLALTVWVVPGLAAGAEFSAQMVLKYKDKLIPGRIFVKDGKMRQEFLDDEGHTITVVRQDKKVYWIILPQDRVYLELPLRGRLPGQFLQLPTVSLKKRALGQEAVNGWETEKYEFTLLGGPSGVRRETYWVSKKLGTPVKMTCTEKNLWLEYRNIREGQVADRLFELPPGYTKMAAPSGRLLEKWE